MIGAINGIAVGATFDSYKALHEAGVHRASQAGIVGTEEHGAESVVLNGGYVDDEDFGSRIIYTGYGGRDETTGRQIADQHFVKENSALITSWITKLPVRVVRGYNHASPFSPKTGYRYDGLFRVGRFWKERGKDDFLICRYELLELKPEVADALGSASSWGSVNSSASQQSAKTRPSGGRGGSGSVRRLALWACKCRRQGYMRDLKFNQAIHRVVCPGCGVDETDGLTLIS